MQERHSQSRFPQQETYDHCFVLVFNFPDIKFASSTENKIFQFFGEKWKKKHHDPEGERLHIIFMSPSDDPTLML